MQLMRSVLIAALLVAPLHAATYAERAAAALKSQLAEFYIPDGRWSKCVPAFCGYTDSDWGADSMSYALWLRWSTTGDTSLVSVLQTLSNRQGMYLPSTNEWSDVPEWDAIMELRAYAATHDGRSLVKAQAAFEFVDSWQASSFARGACPAINYQQPDGGNNQLKTLETDSNYVKAALLLYSATGDENYLDKAQIKYDAIRRYFLDPNQPLYTVYLYDDGKRCAQVPAQFFASVNGNMIWSGEELYHRTGATTYRDNALATAHAVQAHLADSTGVYANLQAENDVVEPLVEAMYVLATDGQAFAAEWILRSAAAMTVRASGIPGRFFNGPVSDYTIATPWQANGGYSLAYAAGKLAPTQNLPANYWAQYISMTLGLTVTDAPRSFTFTGRAVAIIGPIGERCCERGHARVFIDGIETFDNTGIWQNKSSSGIVLPESVLFAWRWPVSGTHMITIAPGLYNAKEGGTYFHMTRYEYVP